MQNSWDNSSDWYQKIVGETGHFYHKEVILPYLLNRFQKVFTTPQKLLDLACGQGVLSRALPKNFPYYVGVDSSTNLIKKAKELNKRKNHHFFIGDVTAKTLPIQEKKFTIATVILALQDFENIQACFHLANNYLDEKGKLFLIINHPCFRIPRQTSWHMDYKQKKQMRLIESYFSKQKIPIQVAPSQKQNSPHVFSYHRPLQDYFEALHESGFVISNLSELISPKVSHGKYAKMENRARKEFPLFLTIEADKISL